MRFYKIEIGQSPSGTSPITYTSQANGVTDAGALDVEFDIPVYDYASPITFPLVRVWGVSLQTISQATDLNGATIKVSGGMAKGLPLANPSQQGVLFEGIVWQAFGNWLGDKMSLDLILTGAGTPPPDGINDAPQQNITLNWQQGQPLGDAIKQALQVAYPSYTINVQTSPNLVSNLGGPSAAGVYGSLAQFAAMLLPLSKSIITDKTYQGVWITVYGSTISVFDGTAGQAAVTQIAFNDLIGQPTWIGPGTVQATLVMRADLHVGALLKWPQTPTVQTAAQLTSQAKDKSSFAGNNFTVKSVRSVGRYRQPDAESWVTVVEAVAPPA